MKEILDLEIRRSIYDLIAKNPGLHARKIAESLSMSGQLTDYHLLYMERNEVLTSIKEGGYRRYYIRGKLGVKDRHRIAILRHETPLKIVLYLLKHPKAQHKELLEVLSVAKSTITYHLKKLSRAGIIIEENVGNEKYYWVENEQEISDLLIRFKPYSRMKSMEDTWTDLTWPGK